DVAEASRLDRERQRHLAELVRRRRGRVARNARTQEVAAAGFHVLSLDRPACHGPSSPARFGTSLAPGKVTGQGGGGTSQPRKPRTARTTSAGFSSCTSNRAPGISTRRASGNCVTMWRACAIGNV